MAASMGTKRQLMNEYQKLSKEPWTHVEVRRRQSQEERLGVADFVKKMC